MQLVLRVLLAQQEQLVQQVQRALKGIQVRLVQLELQAQLV